MKCTQKDLDEFLPRFCLPNDGRGDVEEILQQDGHDQITKSLNILSAHCFRMEPDHPPYDQNRDLFPGSRLDGHTFPV